MLGVDLDLEADLGVDSIKRVEILSALQNQTEVAGRDVEIEGLAKLKTLRAIAEWIVSPPAAPQAAAAPPVVDAPAVRAASNIRDAAVRHAPALPRLTIAVADAALPTAPAIPAPAGAVLLTDDGRQVADRMCVRLTEMGIAAAVISLDRGRGGGAVDAVRSTNGCVAARAPGAARRPATHRA